MKARDENILKKIVSEIDYLEGMLDGLSEADFLGDETLQRAAAMTTINVGELAKQLSDGFYEDNPGTNLCMAARTRDVYAHGYFTLSFPMVFKTAKEDYPALRVEALAKPTAHTPLHNRP